jgi:hypothetical protein
MFLVTRCCGFQLLLASELALAWCMWWAVHQDGGLTSAQGLLSTAATVMKHVNCYMSCPVLHTRKLRVKHVGRWCGLGWGGVR